MMKKISTKLKDMPLSHYVAFSIAVLLIYTVVSLILSCYGVQNDVLTENVYRCFGGEMLFCCLIKLFKLHKEVKVKNGSIP